MSSTIPPIPPVKTGQELPLPPPGTPVTVERDRIIASAVSLPDLIAKAETLDPAMANKLKGQATAASATPVGALVGGAVGLVVTRYGLGWDAATVNLVSGTLILVGGYIAHWVQARVTSIVPPV